MFTLYSTLKWAEMAGDAEMWLLTEVRADEGPTGDGVTSNGITPKLNTEHHFIIYTQLYSSDESTNKTG